MSVASHRVLRERPRRSGRSLRSALTPHWRSCTLRPFRSKTICRSRLSRKTQPSNELGSRRSKYAATSLFSIPATSAPVSISDGEISSKMLGGASQIVSMISVKCNGT